MFGFNFERRRSKALGLFQRAIDDMTKLIEDATERANKLSAKAEVLRRESESLSTDAKNSQATLDKLKTLVV